MKSFVLYTKDGHGVTAFIDLDNPEGEYARLFYSYDDDNYTLVLNGATGLTEKGFVINVPAELVTGVPVVYFYVETSPDNSEYTKVAQGVVKVLPVESGSGGGGPISGSVSVDNFPSVYPLSTGQYNGLIAELQTIVSNTMGFSAGLTNAELRAEPVEVVGDLTVEFPPEQAVVGTVDVGNFPATQTVAGTVALDAPTLAALETITVLVQTGQVIGLDAATLAALESITVSGQVSLDSGTLTALENINAVVSGTVALDSTTLSALESITATVSGAVSITNFPEEFPLPDAQVDALTPQTDALTDTELRASPLQVSASDLDIRNLSVLLDSVTQTLRPSQPYSGSVNTATDEVLVSVGPTERIRLIRNAGHIDPDAGSVFPIVTVKIGSTTIFSDKLEEGMPWSETVCFEGAVGEDLTISTTTGATVYLNMRYEIF